MMLTQTEPNDPYANFDPIRELHRIEMESWHAALAEFEHTEALVTEAVTSQTPLPDRHHINQAPACPADTFQLSQRFHLVPSLVSNYSF